MILNLDKGHFIIASGPVVIEDGKVLLNRHGEDKKAKKYWKFIGGRVEDFDIKRQNFSLEDACLREVKEEMGINVKILAPIKPMLIKHPDKKDTFVILIHYLARRLGQIKASSEIDEWEWFDINHLPKDCAPNIEPVIDEYKRLLKDKIFNDRVKLIKYISKNKHMNTYIF